MKNRHLIPALSTLGLVGLALIASRFYFSSHGDSDSKRPSDTSLPPGAISPSEMLQMQQSQMQQSQMQQSPSREMTRIQDEAISPDGKFIALNIVTQKGTDSRARVAVIETNSGQILIQDKGEIGGGRLAWNEPGQPQQLMIDDAAHALTKRGGRWILTRTGTAIKNAPPSWLRGRGPSIENQTVLRASNLAVWWYQHDSDGQGTLTAEELRTRNEVWLPASISRNRVSYTVKFAAPPLRGKAPRQLAALFDPDAKPFTSILEVWNLSRRTPVFRRTFPERVTRFAWTRDGRTIVLSGTPHADKNAPDSFTDGVTLLEAATGKVRADFALEGLQEAFAVSDDSRYFLTIQNNYVGAKWFSQLAIRSIPDGKIVCRFERDKRIEAQPHFATGNSAQLIWSYDDTVFLQPWRASKAAQKLAPRRLKISLN